jgi:hypothetical protein
VSTYAEVIAAAPSFRRALNPRPRASYDGRANKGDGTVSYWVQDEDLDAALDVIDGVEEELTISVSPLVTITRNVPLQHHRFAVLYAYGYEVEEYHSWEPAVGGKPYTGPQALVTVRYGLPEWASGSELYQKVTVRGTETQENADGATFSGGATPSYAVSIPLPGMSYGVTVFDAVDMDETHENYLRSMSGRVNNATWRGNPAGTVRYHSPTIDYSRKRDGTRTSQYSLQFDAKPRDWNYEMKRDGSLAALLVNGANRFTTLDFTSLFI